MRYILKVFPLISGVLGILSFEGYPSTYNFENMNIFDVQIDLTKIDISLNIEFPDDQMDGTLTTGISYQLGEGNRAEILQSFTGDTALIYQSGLQNIAYISQEAPNNLALIYQEGMKNEAKQTQRGNNNKAIAVQIGEGNVAKQKQLSSNNLAIVYQEGVGNYAEQIQGYAGGDGHRSYIVQRGDYKYIKVVQY